jgi:hypothetical protein
MSSIPYDYARGDDYRSTRDIIAFDGSDTKKPVADGTTAMRGQAVPDNQQLAQKKR